MKVISMNIACDACGALMLSPEEAAQGHKLKTLRREIGKKRGWTYGNAAGETPKDHCPKHLHAWRKDRNLE